MVTTPEAIDVHLYGVHIATVTPGDTIRNPRRLQWVWTDQAATRWGVGSEVVSHSLPIRQREKGLDARATVFIDGLLPEGELRTRRAMDLGIDPDDTFGLFSRCGVDTAGAITVTAAGETPAPRSIRPGPALNPDELSRRLREAGAGRFRDELTSISLAGLVPKIGVVRDAAGAWRLPGPGQPSTGIIKEAHSATSTAADVVDTEALCLDLGRRCRVTDVDAEILDLGDVRAIAVRRYDRLGDGTRIHQEDLAQALGLATDNPEGKFQRGRAMPSWRHAAEVLRSGGGPLSPLARLVTFSFLVGNTDHHAKNTSFIRHENGTVRLASAYDIAAHLHHPGQHTFALDIAGERDAETVTIDHVVEEITSWEVPHARAVDAARDVVVDLSAALVDVDRRLHPGVPTSGWQVIESRMNDAMARLGSS